MAPADDEQLVRFGLNHYFTLGNTYFRTQIDQRVHPHDRHPRNIRVQSVLAKRVHFLRSDPLGR